MSWLARRRATRRPPVVPSAPVDVDAYGAELESAQRAAATLPLRPPVPLRRPVAEAFEAIASEADRLLGGSDDPTPAPATVERRRGPGRRASDYRP